MKLTWKKVQAKLGLNIPMLLLMLKGAIAPTVGLAIYQSLVVAKHFSTIGYLIPIMSILTLPVAPRARFFQNLVVTMLLVGLAVALSFLSMWCAVRARANTTHIPKEGQSGGPVSGAQVSPYNAAASVNMAVWLFFEVWLANTFRAFRPQYFLPSIVFSIFIQVTATYGTQFATLHEAGELVRRLVETFFVGFGLSAAVNVLVLPITTRKLVTIRITENLHIVQKTLNAQHHFLQSVQSRDCFFLQHEPDSPHHMTIPWPEADTVQNTTMELARKFGEIKSELRYAKREAGWAHLGPKELVELTRLLQRILVSLLWMESIVKATKRLEIDNREEHFKGLFMPHTMNGSERKRREEEKRHWDWIFEQRHGPTEQLFQAMQEVVNDSIYTLRLGKPPPEFKWDLESNRHNATANLESMIESFIRERQGVLDAWITWADMNHPSHVESLKSGGRKTEHSRQRELYQFRLYLFLDMEYALVKTARSVLDLAKYADSKTHDGTMKKKRFIIPTWKRMKKWVWASLRREDLELDYQKYSRRSGSVAVYLGDVLHGTHPEHLPPRTMWERISDIFRIFFHVFGSTESVFGFRVAVATMSVAIVAFLRNSQHFYIEQRLIWGTIIIAISMTMTVGSAMYGQAMRFLGTAIGVVMAYIDWYIVDGQPSGVIVFVGVSMFLFHYSLLRFPADPVVPIIGMVTVMLVVGYALQVKKVGVKISESNGQIYHALFILSPYRLATVVGGIGVAFLFTFFPSVTTVRSRLRKDLGSFIYLLAHYYGSVYTNASLRVRNLAGDKRNKKSLGRVLDKARGRLLAKEIVLLQGMKQHAAFASWEPRLGGRFPTDTYKSLTEHARNILQLSGVLGVIIKAFEETSTDPSSSELWLKDFKHLIASLDLRSHDIASFLTAIASAIETAKPLPVHLKAPKIHLPSKLLADINADLMDVQHVYKEAYSVIAAIEITMAMLEDDMAQLLSETKTLVGELNPLKDVVPSRELPADVDSILAAEKRD